MTKISLGVIIRNKKLLVGKLKQEQGANFKNLIYVLPGGTVKEFEGVEETLIREVKEETNLETTCYKLIHSRIHPITQNEMFYFFCEVIPGKENTQNPENDDLEELIWINKSEIDKYMPTLCPEVKTFVENLL